MVLVGSGTMVLLSIAAISAVGTSLHDAELANGGVSRIGRCQMITLLPRADQQDLLSAVVDLELSDSVKTVGEAITAVLENSGYRLSSNPAAPCQEKFLKLPLPAVHREIGPLTLRQALAILSGPVYRPAPDTLMRQVSFERVQPSEPDATPDCDCD